jgi:hypothetical protein
MQSNRHCFIHGILLEWDAMEFYICFYYLFGNLHKKYLNYRDIKQIAKLLWYIIDILTMSWAYLKLNIL